MTSVPELKVAAVLDLVFLRVGKIYSLQGPWPWFSFEAKINLCANAAKVKIFLTSFPYERGKRIYILNRCGTAGAKHPKYLFIDHILNSNKAGGFFFAGNSFFKGGIGLICFNFLS